MREPAVACPAPAAAPPPGPLARAVASRGFLAGVLALAAALRVAHVLALRRLPMFDRLIIDSAAYDAWARRPAAQLPWYVDESRRHRLVGALLAWVLTFIGMLRRMYGAIMSR